jgi:hypothetical protein
MHTLLVHCRVDRPVLVCELLRYYGFMYRVCVIRTCRGSLFSYHLCALIGPLPCNRTSPL